MAKKSVKVVKTEKPSKVRAFFKKLFYTLLVWGRPLVRKKINGVLVPAVEEKLKEMKVSKKSVDAVVTLIKEFSGKYI
jgi:hypothetical protein